MEYGAAALRLSVDEGLRCCAAGLVPAPLKVGAYSLQMSPASAALLSLSCVISFGQSFSDEVLQKILQLALPGARYFDAPVLVHCAQGELRLLRLLDDPHASEAWSACEQMLNQASVWTDLVCREIWQRQMQYQRLAAGFSSAAGLRVGVRRAPH